MKRGGFENCGAHVCILLIRYFIMFQKQEETKARGDKIVEAIAQQQ